MTRGAGYKLPELTIGNVLADKAATGGDRPFLSFLPDGRVYTYRDVDAMTNRIANGLRATGIGQGTHVAVMMDNCPEQVWTYFALGKIGAVAVPINSGAKGQLLHYFLTYCDATALVVAERMLEHFLAIADGIPALDHVIVLAEADGFSNRLHRTPAAMMTGFSQLLAHPDRPLHVNVRFSDLAYLLLTSGTTGRSKAIMYTHAHALFWGADFAAHYHLGPGDIAYVYLPLFHANGLLSGVYAQLMAGGSVAMTHRFSASRFWEDVRACGATMVHMVGSIPQMLWNRPELPEDRRHSLRLCNATVPKYGEAFEQRFGVRLVHNYGLSDYALATVRGPDDPIGKLDSAGRPRRGMEVRVVDDDDLDLPVNTIGEIVLRSNNPWGAALGYYKMPEATAAANRNMWFHTGDRGYLDEDGFLYFVDRKKDAIRRRGENISAYEVEQVIVAHPAVAEAAVYPVASELGEDEVAASIALKAGAELSPEALIEYCQVNLAYFMVPRFVEFVVEFPRTLTAKIEKYKLRSQAERDRGRFWDREKAGIVLRR